MRSLLKEIPKERVPLQNAFLLVGDSIQIKQQNLSKWRRSLKSVFYEAVHLESWTLGIWSRYRRSPHTRPHTDRKKFKFLAKIHIHWLVGYLVNPQSEGVEKFKILGMGKVW